MLGVSIALCGIWACALHFTVLGLDRCMEAYRARTAAHLRIAVALERIANK